MRVDDQHRLIKDPEIECYKGAHKIWAMSLAIPAIIVWGLGIPLFAYFLMSKEKKTLNTLETK
jgi:hypothetical protein